MTMMITLMRMMTIMMMLYQLYTSLSGTHVVVVVVVVVVVAVCLNMICRVRGIPLLLLQHHHVADVFNVGVLL